MKQIQHSLALTVCWPQPRRTTASGRSSGKPLPFPARWTRRYPNYRLLIRQHHAAILAADVDKVVQLRREADLLALHLNDGGNAILTLPDAPG